MTVDRKLGRFTLVLGLPALCVGITAGTSLSLAQEKPSEKTAARPKAEDSAPAARVEKPSTVKVERGPFKVEVNLSGVFESSRMSEVSIRPRAWSMPLLVERAIELGTPVKRGDILVELDHEKIDKTIQDAEIELGTGELALKLAAEELPVLESLLPLDLAAAERSKAQADEDLTRFLQIDRPNSEKVAAFSVKSATEYLEYAKEELRQLEKMYRSKDLTEETEEIILRRTRFQVESGEFRLKEAEFRRDASLKVELPRQEIKVRESAVRQALELQKARATLPLTLNQKRVNLAKLKHDHARTAEKLADLRHDRDLFTIHAPADGLVYYGRDDHGNWPGAGAMASKLRKGGAILADEVFITVVAPRPLVIRSAVDEKELHHLAGRSELKGRATPAAEPALSLPVRLTRLVSAPREPGRFEVLADVELNADAALIKPGMVCNLTFTTYRARDALAVPASAVFQDEAEDGSVTQMVYMPGKDGKPAKRTVRVGKTSGGKSEILDGLAAGDEILANKP
jgi:multidrug efflux pump subunit AcrA (membrane-fusion protein)